MLKTENTCLVVIDLQEKLMPAIKGIAPLADSLRSYASFAKALARLG